MLLQRSDFLTKHVWQYPEFCKKAISRMLLWRNLGQHKYNYTHLHFSCNSNIIFFGMERRTELHFQPFQPDLAENQFVITSCMQHSTIWFIISRILSCLISEYLGGIPYLISSTCFYSEGWTLHWILGFIPLSCLPSVWRFQPE